MSSWWPGSRRPAGVSFKQALGVHGDTGGIPTAMVGLSTGAHLSLDMDELADCCRHIDERVSCGALPRDERKELLRERGIAVQAAAMLHNRYPAVPLLPEIIHGFAPHTEPAPSAALQQIMDREYGALISRLIRSTTGPQP